MVCVVCVIYLSINQLFIKYSVIYLIAHKVHLKDFNPLSRQITTPIMIKVPYTILHSRHPCGHALYVYALQELVSKAW